MAASGREKPVAVNIAQLIEALKHQNACDRRRAVDVLLEIRPQAAPAIAALADCLGDRDTGVGECAAEALVRIGSEAILVLCNVLTSKKIIRSINSIDPFEVVTSYICLGQHDTASRLYHYSDTSRERAAEALRRIGSNIAPAIAAWFTVLMDEDIVVRLCAERAVERLGPDALPGLCQVLRHENVVLRRIAAKVLGITKPNAAAATASLIEASRDQDDEVREHAEYAMRQFGLSLPQLVKVLCRPNYGYRASDIYKLKHIFKPVAEQAIPALIEALENKDARVRQSAAFVLFIFGADLTHTIPTLMATLALREEVGDAAEFILNQIAPYVIPISILIENIYHESTYVTRFVRSTIIDQLKTEPSTLDALFNAARHSNLSIRIEVVSILANHNHKDIYDTLIPNLIEDLRSPDAEMRQYAMKAIRRLRMSTLPEYTIPELIVTLHEKDEEVRQFAADELGKIGSVAAPAISELVAALHDTSKEMRRSAATALGNIGPIAAPAIPELIEALRDKCNDVRRSAATALGNIGPIAAPAIPELIEALRDTCENVQVYAAKALGMLVPYSALAIPALISVLNDFHPLGKAAASTLEKIGPSAVPALLIRFKNDDPRKHNVVIEILKRMNSPNQHIIDATRILALDLNEPLTVRGRAVALIEHFDPVAARTISADRLAFQVRTGESEWDVEAGPLLSQLKAFYLLGRLYKEGITSFRGAASAIGDVSNNLQNRFDGEDIAQTAAGFSYIKNGPLRIFFGKVLGKPAIAFFTEPNRHIGLGSYRSPSGVGVQISDDGWKAWDWTDAFLRRKMSTTWFGFSRLTRENGAGL